MNSHLGYKSIPSFCTNNTQMPMKLWPISETKGCGHKMAFTVTDMTQKTNYEAMRAFCNNTGASKSHQKALLGAIAYNIYFARAAGALNPQNQIVVDWLECNPLEIKLLKELASNNR
jgi:hypothetical protein